MAGWIQTKKKRVCNIIFVSLLSLHIHLSSGNPLSFLGGGSNPLYGPQDKVSILNVTTIRDQIFNSERVWFVEFYSSWCGHCINFAPRWIKFAEDLYDWREVVEVAAIDCADENNTPTCRDFNIMGYPTLRLFPPRSPPLVEASEREKSKGINKTVNKGLDVQKTESMEKLKRTLIDDLTQYYPNLLLFSKLKGSSFTELWGKTEFRHNVQPSVLLFIYESDLSYVGKEVALRLSKYNAIKVYRFNAKNPVYDQLKLRGWPAAGYVVDNGSSGAVALGSDNLIDSLCNSAVALAHVPESGRIISCPEDVLNDVCKSRQSGLPLPGLKQDDVSPQEVPNSKDLALANNADRDVLSMDDLLHACRDLLHKEIALIRTIAGEKLESLKLLVGILSKLFPADRREVKLFFQKLEEWITSRNEIESSDFLAKLDALETEFHPWDIDLNRWVECQGTTPARRGYTCGLWRLFHTLTILGVQKSSNLKVLEAIHSFVRDFFGCRECKEHFTGMVRRDKILSVDSIMSQALWLWKTHNEVNLRLKGTLSEDPGYPKQKYPSKRQCPDCYENGGVNFDEGKVMEYLLKVYSNPQRHHESGHQRATDDNLVANARDGRIGGASAAALVSEQDVNLTKSQQSWFGFFSIADIGLFMIVYLSVACLLLLGYVHFKMVGRRRLNPAVLFRKFCAQSIV